MDRIGIMPLQIPKYFSKVSSLESHELLLTPEEGLEKFNSLNLEIDDKEYINIINEDLERENYGDVLIRKQRV